MLLPESKLLQEYHEAVRAKNPIAPELYARWREELRERLDALQLRTEQHVGQVVVLKEKGRGYKPVYDALVKDYREAVQLAKMISKVKERMRSERLKGGVVASPPLPSALGVLGESSLIVG